jgi:hypothetical protein
MPKIWFAVSFAALIVAFVVGFVVADSQARHAPRAMVQPSVFETMTGAKQLPSEHFADYSFVFN